MVKSTGNEPCMFLSSNQYSNLLDFSSLCDIDENMEYSTKINYDDEETFRIFRALAKVLGNFLKYKYRFKIILLQIPTIFKHITVEFLFYVILKNFQHIFIVNFSNMTSNQVYEILK